MLSRKFLVTGVVKSKKDGSLYASGLIYNEKNKSWSQRGSNGSYSNYLIPCTHSQKEDFEENMGKSLRGTLLLVMSATGVTLGSFLIFSISFIFFRFLAFRGLPTVGSIELNS